MFTKRKRATIILLRIGKPRSTCIIWFCSNWFYLFYMSYNQFTERENWFYGYCKGALKCISSILAGLRPETMIIITMITIIQMSIPNTGTKSTVNILYVLHGVKSCWQVLKSNNKIFNIKWSWFLRGTRHYTGNTQKRPCRTGLTALWLMYSHDSCWLRMRKCIPAYTHDHK